MDSQRVELFPKMMQIFFIRKLIKIDIPPVYC